MQSWKDLQLFLSKRNFERLEMLDRAIPAKKMYSLISLAVCFNHILSIRRLRLSTLQTSGM